MVDLTLSVPARLAVLTRRIRLLTAATIAYNVIEALIALATGVVSSSTALVAFGIDSVIEVSSAAGVAWQFSARDHAQRESREHVALRVTALSFFGLTAFIIVEAVRSLAGSAHAGPSTIGVVLAAVSLVVMPALSVAQRRAGRQLGSASAVADSKQTLLCTYMSAVLLVGLLANATLGWWWADPVAGLAIAGLAAREGVNAWRGDACCATAMAPTSSSCQGDCDCC